MITTQLLATATQKEENKMNYEEYELEKLTDLLDIDNKLKHTLIKRSLRSMSISRFIEISKKVQLKQDIYVCLRLFSKKGENTSYGHISLFDHLPNVHNIEDHKGDSLGSAKYCLKEGEEFNALEEFLRDKELLRITNQTNVYCINLERKEPMKVATHYGFMLNKKSTSSGYICHSEKDPIVEYRKKDHLYPIFPEDELTATIESYYEDHIYLLRKIDN